ncbi:MAG: hypothetical protein J3K34DRAFT_430893 [Monoraphidium minutum]|nr:MAG: hypothetical protein J3K34DRAFT_430893 [Monoraphidium minutum]
MSQCPDANFCEHALAPVVAQLRSIVQVTTRYIQHFDDGGAVVCKHGEGECRGNLLQLCTQAHVPPEHNFDWFYRSLLCGWDSGLPANDTSRLDSCLSQVGVDDGLKGSIQGCYDGSEGSDLMQANTQLIEARGIPNSCTVVVDGTPRCVRDGGEWRDCPGGSEPADFVQTLCDAYKTKTGTAAFECPPAPSAA